MPVNELTIDLKLDPEKVRGFMDEYLEEINANVSKEIFTKIEDLAMYLDTDDSEIECNFVRLNDILELKKEYIDNSAEGGSE